MQHHTRKQRSDGNHRPLVGWLGVAAAAVVAAAPSVRAQEYSTGFEAADGWVPGFVCGPAFADCTDPLSDPAQNCGPGDPNPVTGWYLLDSATSCTEPRIDTANPFEGEQHLRFAQDPQRAADSGLGCPAFDAACEISALNRPAPAPPNVFRTTIAMDIAASNTFGSDLHIIPQSTTGASPGMFIDFNYYGTLVVHGDPRSERPIDIGVYWATGSEYKSLSIEVDGCLGVVRYYYDGLEIWSSPSADSIPWTASDQVLLRTDNFPETFDIDNFSIVHTAGCPPAECGNDVREPAAGEECDHSDDLACPGRCLDDCTCRPIVCGDGILEADEECDGNNAPACPGLCEEDCTCPEPVCGNDVREVGEECDGADDSSCRGLCDGRCECRDPGACCDWSTGICEENTTPASCPAGGTWMEGAQCTDLDCRLATAWVALVPVDPYGLEAGPYPTGTHIEADTIIIPPSRSPDSAVRLWFEIRAGGWAPDELQTAQATINGTGLLSGTGEPLRRPLIECTAAGANPHYMCEAVLGPGSRCTKGLCEYGFIDRARSDHVFAGVQAAVAYDIFSPNPRWGGTTLQLTPRPSVVDTGQPFYVGTMVLDVPETASGTYTIPFVPIASFMTDALGGEIRIIRATPVHIRVAPDCCLPDGSCAAIMPEMCVAGGGVLGACAGDCDGNGIDEGCGLFADCNDSGLPDSCDIAGGTSSDEDGNCIPDECDAEPAPIAEANGVFKNRFISFQTTIAGCETAIRVELVSLNHPDPPSTAGVAESDFSAFEGEYRWVGPPEVLEESVRPLSYFNAAALRCEPYFMDWSSVGLIHVYGTEIVPSSTYNVQFVDVSCDNWNDPACGMKTLRINTGRWGDVVAPFHAADGGSQPDFSDIAAIVDKFVRLPFPLTASAELNPNLPNPAQFIDFRDVSAAVDAFGGMPYPYAGPDKCP